MTSIPRHKTAIRRGDFSRPIKCALRDGLINQSASVFDYGCGRGEDLELLTGEGITCTGWDPAYRPESEKTPADVVNLGYVINVVEDPIERARRSGRPGSCHAGLGRLRAGASQWPG